MIKRFSIYAFAIVLLYEAFQIISIMIYCAGGYKSQEAEVLSMNLDLTCFWYPETPIQLFTFDRRENPIDQSIVYRKFHVVPFYGKQMVVSKTGIADFATGESFMSERLGEMIQNKESGAQDYEYILKNFSLYVTSNFNKIDNELLGIKATGNN